MRSVLPEMAQMDVVLERRVLVLWSVWGTGAASAQEPPESPVPREVWVQGVVFMPAQPGQAL